MPFTITTLTENTSSVVGLLGEWGLCILIENHEISILFDTGLGISVEHNANELKIDLSKIEKIVLSHGHIDHTGGLKNVIVKTGTVDVIAHPDAWSKRFTHTPGYEERDIGNPFSKKEIESVGASVSLSREPIWISEDIMTTGEIPMVTAYEDVDTNLYIEENGQHISDKIWDDQALIIKTDLGLVVLLGCAHRGAINTIYHAREISGEERVYAVIGGTHLLRASEERLNETISELKKLGVQRLGVSHCTGQWSSVKLANELGSDIVFFNNAGTRIIIP